MDAREREERERENADQPFFFAVLLFVVREFRKRATQGDASVRRVGFVASGSRAALSGAARTRACSSRSTSERRAA